MALGDVIQLEVPGVLAYRDVVLRVLSAGCKKALPQYGVRQKAAESVVEHVISAVGEAFNNIALHGYDADRKGTIRMELELTDEGLVIRLQDFGKSFDPTSVLEPDLDALPESGLGIFIMRSFMDDVTYRPGRPNQTIMLKKMAGRV